MRTLTLKFKLLSAATFGRGDGVPGLVDQEVEHDDLGLPYLRGRALRGLLAEEVEGTLYALQQAGRHATWQGARDRLLGVPGAGLDRDTAILHVGDARLPAGVRLLVEQTLRGPSSGLRLRAEDVLDSLTAIRRQTAMTPLGAPDHATLRAIRVVLRGTPFEAPLVFEEDPTSQDLALLAAAVRAWRRAGAGRNRGRGRLRAWLEEQGQDVTRVCFEPFKQAVMAT